MLFDKSDEITFYADVTWEYFSERARDCGFALLSGKKGAEFGLKDNIFTNHRFYPFVKLTGQRAQAGIIVTAVFSFMDLSGVKVHDFVTGEVLPPPDLPMWVWHEKIGPERTARLRANDVVNKLIEGIECSFDIPPTTSPAKGEREDYRSGRVDKIFNILPTFRKAHPREYQSEIATRITQHFEGDSDFSERPVSENDIQTALRKHKRRWTDMLK